MPEARRYLIRRYCKPKSISIAIAIAIASLLCMQGCGEVKSPSSQTSKHIYNDWQTLVDRSQEYLPPTKSAEISSCLKKLPRFTEVSSLAHSSNYGKRLLVTEKGNTVPHQPSIIVIHETVMSAPEAIALFRTEHRQDSMQVSYHMVIDRAGKAYRIVPDEFRAYGSGMSHFGGFTIRTKDGSAGSINNISLHVSLESPPDTENADSHLGYTSQQYSALAYYVLMWQLKNGIPMSYVTTHASVDRSHTRYDPRSFRWDLFDAVHGSYSKICGFQQYSQPV
jgi:N-acetyl-anhydromuramyl-L-alanine amidase AmpD